MKINILLKHFFLFVFLLRTSKNVNKCQYFTRFYGFDDSYIAKINMDLADVYLQNMKKDIDVAFWNFLVTNLCLTLSLIYIFYTCVFVF